MTPLDLYHQQCQSGLIFEDPQQLSAMQNLQRVYHDLIQEQHKRSGFLSYFHSSQLVKGLTIWGGVGIGKTLMMDCFYQCLPFPQKMRMHFHQFMQLVHQALRRHQGEQDPLQVIAKELAQKTNVLCFDELFVSDITDAMLLGRLFKALFARKVCLVTTSNVPPDDLYKNGLQRDSFLPAIEMLKTHTDVIHVPTVMDYRLRHLKEAGVFYTPLDDAARDNMEKSFVTLCSDQPVSFDPIVLFGRSIRIKKLAGDTVWFDFKDLCGVPRSQHDYLAIAKQYKTVFISDIPIIPEHQKDIICLFISMVDVFYDARVRLVISAAEPVSELYSRDYMVLEYTRTHSRLLEMQSIDYFSGES